MGDIAWPTALVQVRTVVLTLLPEVLEHTFISILDVTTLRARASNGMPVTSQ